MNDESVDMTHIFELAKATQMVSDDIDEIHEDAMKSVTRLLINAKTQDDHIDLCKIIAYMKTMKEFANNQIQMMKETIEHMANQEMGGDI